MLQVCELGLLTYFKVIPGSHRVPMSAESLESLENVMGNLKGCLDNFWKLINKIPKDFQTRFAVSILTL